MEKHWSACRGGQPYGFAISSLVAVLQVSAFYEMIDKISTHGRPRARHRDLEQPLIAGSHPHKGSQGENVMRGVRKLCIVNSLEAMLSLWIHIELLPGPSKALSVWASASVVVSLFSLAVGVADLVLYIWVLDAFVKENKKLVTFHYVVEIASRIPLVVKFHITYSRDHNYTPTYLLFTIDVLLTSLLLFLARWNKPVRTLAVQSMTGLGRFGCSACCCFPCVPSKQATRQFVYSLVVSFILFFFNIVYFDPNMIFQNINQAFYVIKYLELLVMLWLMTRRDNSFDNSILGEPALVAVCIEGVLFAANAILVFTYIPRRRHTMYENLVYQNGVMQASSVGIYLCARLGCY
eukprot:4174978-Amphidinium_carterae.1